MRTLIIDNGSQYLGKIQDHVNAAADEQGIDHEVVRLSVNDLQAAYDKGDTGVVKGFGYVISSGSGKYRKIDTELPVEQQEITPILLNTDVLIIPFVVLGGYFALKLEQKKT